METMKHMDKIAHRSTTVIEADDDDHRYWFSADGEFKTDDPITFPEFDEAGLRAYHAHNSLSKGITSWMQYGLAHFSEEQLDNLAVLSEEYFTESYVSQLIHTARNIHPKNLPKAKNISHLREAARIRDPQLQAEVLDAGREQNETKDQFRTRVNKVVAKDKGKGKIAVPLPFSHTVRYPASKPGQTVHDWIINCVATCHLTLQAAAEAHADGDHVTQAKKESRRQGKARRKPAKATAPAQNVKCSKCESPNRPVVERGWCKECLTKQRDRDRAYQQRKRDAKKASL